MVKITVINLQNKYPINPRGIKKIILKTLSLEKIKKNGEITISFVNDSRIKELNLRYLKKNNPTDVLAFDISESESRLLADIVISTDTALSNSRIFKTPSLYELYLYVIHGLLHLLGYDDRRVKQRQAMQEKAESILRKFNLRESACPANLATFKAGFRQQVNSLAG